MAKKQLFKRYALILSCIAILALTLAGCTLSAYMWIARDSTASNLVFVISSSGWREVTGEIRHITVYRCADVYFRDTGGYYPPSEEAVWIATTLNGMKGPRTSRIVYGASQQGLKTTQGPESLSVPGCYVVLAYADYGDVRPASLGFHVQEDGKVVQMGEAEHDKLFSSTQ